MRVLPIVLILFIAASFGSIGAHFPDSPPIPMPIFTSEGVSYSCWPNGSTPISDTALTDEPINLHPTPLDLMQVHFINVGKGDAILIDLAETEILIDGGRELPGIVDYLTHYVDGSLEIMIATHPHDDHIGGLVEVLAEFDVEQIWHNAEKIDRRLCREFFKAVDAEESATFVARLGDTIEVGELKLRVLGPANLDSTINNNSIVLMFSYGLVDFLFAADAEKDAEQQMLEQSTFPIDQVELLKVGHHGLSNSSSTEVLQIVQPEVAVVMANHRENKQTLCALEEMGADVFVTSMNGTIVIDTDGHGFTIRCEQYTKQ